MQLLDRFLGNLDPTRIDSKALYLVRDAHGSVTAGRVMETGRLWERRATDVGLVAPHLTDQRRPHRSSSRVVGYLGLILMRSNPTEEDLQALREAPAVTPSADPTQAQQEVDAWGAVISGETSNPRVSVGNGWSIQHHNLRIVTTVVDPRRVRSWRG